jgi:hypothetical protein
MLRGLLLTIGSPLYEYMSGSSFSMRQSSKLIPTSRLSTEAHLPHTPRFETTPSERWPQIPSSDGE